MKARISPRTGKPMRKYTRREPLSEMGEPMSAVNAFVDARMRAAEAVSYQGHPDAPGSGYWLTDDGRMLSINRMSTAHLINVAAMIWKGSTMRAFGQALNMGLSYAWYVGKLTEILNELEARRRRKTRE